jgi:hypothetical protein
VILVYLPVVGRFAFTCNNGVLRSARRSATIFLCLVFLYLVKVARSGKSESVSYIRLFGSPVFPPSRPQPSASRTPESTPRCLIQNRSNFAIFIQTILANFYPKLARIRQTQFLSKFRIRPSKTSNFPFFFFFFFSAFPTVCILYVY